jgi:phospho-N-acetylmuramoyl-pentapeptide-transferase
VKLNLLMMPEAATVLLAGGTFVLTLLTGGRWVAWLRAKQIGKQVRSDALPQHLVKTGTPTMGGIMIVASAVIMTVVFNLVGRWSMVLPLAVLVSYAILGGYDDFLTLTGSRAVQGDRFGLSARAKLGVQVVLGLIAALAIYLPRDYFGLEHGGAAQIPFRGEVNIPLSWYMPIAVGVIVATSNAVNLTDGVDSLAAWTLTLAFGAYGVISFIAEPRLPYLQAFCFTMVGANAAFLWFNAHPAQVIMGDTGALALGAALGVVALMSQHWVLLPIVGVVFVAETISVILQVGYFKWTRWRSGVGRRLFRRTPLHSHFELGGWSEPQVMQRFVVIGMIGLVVGVALALSTPPAPRSAVPPVGSSHVTTR